MNTLTKGIAVAVLHILIVLSLGGKLLYDRAHRPRVWVRTGSFDPDLPIRGRYVTLSLQVHAPDLAPPDSRAKDGVYGMYFAELAVEKDALGHDQLVAHKSNHPTDLYVTMWRMRPDQAPREMFLLTPAVAFFLPEHAEFPRLKPGEEIWAEVTIPRKGPPRPIQLALKRGTEWRPLNYR